MKTVVRKVEGRATIAAGPSYWVFQFRNTDDISSIQQGHTYRWQAHSKIRVGDSVVLWKSGDDAGVFGFGKVVASAIKQPFHGKPISLRFKVTDKRDEVLPKAILKKDRLVGTLSVVAGGSFGAGITAASPPQFRRLADLYRATSSTNYWIFQANPRTGDDLREFLISHPKSGWWRLTRFRDPREHVRPGDKVVLWQVEGDQPAASGVYAIGEITKRPQRANGTWRGYYRLKMVRDLDNPVSAKLLRADPGLRKIPAFSKKAAQGSNFRIDRKQWEKIRDYFERDTTGNEARPLLEPTREIAEGPDTALVPGTDAHEMELRERRLVQAYQRYLQRKGAHARPYAIRLPDENSIACDLYDKSRGNLIEAKSVVCRESVRMAIGQLADYVRFIRPRPKLAVLLPARPRAELEELLRSQAIQTIWQTEDGDFLDNSPSRRFT